MALSRAIVVAVGSSLALVVACGGDGSSTGPPGNGTTTPPPATAQVAMISGTDPYGDESHAFDPTAATIQRTGTVTWSNSSGVVHNVTFAPQQGAPAHVSDLASGSAARTFNAAGEFHYECTNHPGMAGRIVVEN